MERNDILKKWRQEVQSELEGIQQELRRGADLKREAEVRSSFLGNIWQRYPGYSDTIQQEIQTLTSKIEDLENSPSRREKQRRAQYLENVISELDASLS